MDERARALAREAEKGDPGARIAFTVQRLRSGLVGAEQLRLAAWLGDGAARAMLGESPPPEPTETQAWLEALGEFGQPVLVRAGIAASECFLSEWPEVRQGDRRPHDALEAAERWLAEPSEDNARAAGVAAAPANQAFDEAPGRAAIHGVVGQDGEYVAPGDLVPMFPRAALGAGLAAAAAWSASTPAYAVTILANVLAYADPTLEREARAAIRERLVPWCLGWPSE